MLIQILPGEKYYRLPYSSVWVKVPYQSAHYFSIDSYMKTLLKPEAFINVTICSLTSSSGQAATRVTEPQELPQ